jgi:precorrin-6B methylase 2
MRNAFKGIVIAMAFAASTALVAQTTAQQTAQKPFEPTVGQNGKDVVWVPTPQVLVEKMLDMAKVTPKDLVIDLGSGDGRTVITAAKRGATALGIEYNPDMVGLSRKNAADAGVSKTATFQQADLFETDFSKADVVTMFLLPNINLRLRPTILNMKPGTRIVTNTFTMDDWEEDAKETVEKDCTSWCTALLWIVPAKVEGTWTVGNDTLTLQQKYQMLTGTLGSTAVTGRLRGNEITLTAGNVRYAGQVDAKGTGMSGTITGGRTGNWSATKK